MKVPFRTLIHHAGCLATLASLAMTACSPFPGDNRRPQPLDERLKERDALEGYLDRVCGPGAYEWGL